MTIALPPLSHLLYELTTFALGLVCVRHASRQGRTVLFSLLAAMLYGLLIELVGMTPRGTSGQNYHYGQFLLVLFPGQSYALPVCIFVGWGILVYAVIQTTTLAREGSWFVWPFINALLAVSLDFIQDPAASGPGGLDLWYWSPLSDNAWIMGIPLINFVGWFVVVFSFSFFTLLGRRLVPPGSRGVWGDMAVAAAAVPLALVADLPALALYHAAVWERPWAPAVLALLLLSGLVMFVRFAPVARRDNPVDLVVLGVPAFYLVFFIGAMLFSGAFAVNPTALVLIPIFALISLVGFCWPYSQTILARLNTRPLPRAASPGD